MSDAQEANGQDAQSAGTSNDEGATSSTATEEDVSVEKLKAENEALQAQLKGQQRANERLRGDLKDRVKAEDTASRLAVMSESFEKLAGVLKEAGDEQVAAAVDEVLGASRTASESISRETEAQTTIADELGKVGLDWEDPKLEAARAYYDSGNYDKAQEAVRTVVSNETNKSIEEQVEERLQEKLKEAGGVVNSANASQGGTPPPEPEGKDKLIKDLDSGDYDPLAALAEANRLAQEG